MAVAPAHGLDLFHAGFPAAAGARHRAVQILFASCRWAGYPGHRWSPLKAGAGPNSRASCHEAFSRWYWIASKGAVGQSQTGTIR